MAVANIVRIGRSMEPGSKLILSDLIEYEAVQRSFALIEHELVKDPKISFQKVDFKRSTRNNGDASEEEIPKTTSDLRSPFWAGKLGTDYPTSPIPTAVSQHVIGHFADGGSKARRNLFCGFRIFEKSQHLGY